MKLIFLTVILFSVALAKGQSIVKPNASEDSVCIKVKPSIKMENGVESRILILTNICDQPLDIQIYKQNKKGHWFSTYYENMSRGESVRTGVSLSGKYFIYKRMSGSVSAFPSLADIEKKKS